MVKNLPSNAGDTGSIPGQGTKISDAVGQLSPCATTTEPACSGPCVLRTPHGATREAHTLQQKIPCAATKIPRVTMKNRSNQIIKKRKKRETDFVSWARKMEGTIITQLFPLAETRKQEQEQIWGRK